jgi:probable F420-dependent oxidoreductase
MMRLGISIPVEEGLSLERLVGLATAAERCGYDAVVAGEVAGPDVFALLGAIACATERVKLGTGVVPLATRSPALLAMGFQSVASLAPGRVVAGVGVSSPTVVERWHGRTFAPPLAYVREALPALRAALAGEKLAVAGEHVRSDGFRLTLPAGPPVPIVLGAMRPRMIRLAGELADGAFLTWCPPEEAAEAVELVRAGAREAGRDPGELLVIASFFAYAGPQLDLARERMRRYVLQYASVSTHRDSFARSITNLDEVEAAWREGDRKRALSLVSDEAVDRLTPLGADAAVRRARDLHAAGVDLPVMVVTAAARGDADGPLATIEAVAAALEPAPTGGAA